MSNRPTHLAPGPEALWDWLERQGVNQREGAVKLQIHYMSLNQILQGRRKPALATALRIEQHSGIPAGIWVRTRVSGVKRRKSKSAVTVNKQVAYSHGL